MRKEKCPHFKENPPPTTGGALRNKGTSYGEPTPGASREKSAPPSEGRTKFTKSRKREAFVA